jgi:hypothetical protein
MGVALTGATKLLFMHCFWTVSADAVVWLCDLTGESASVGKTGSAPSFSEML